MVGCVRLYYVVFCWFWVIWCLNTAKNEFREKVEICLFILGWVRVMLRLFESWCLNSLKKELLEEVETC